MTTPSLIVVDAGNTNSKTGVFDATLPAAHELPSCRFFKTVEIQADPPIDELREHVHGSPAGIVAGSNPEAADRVRDNWPGEWPAPRIILNGSQLLISVDVDFPDRVGIDRLLGAVAAIHLREPGQPAIVIDSGTATTVDFVNSDGCFCGGAILPGFDLCARALHEHTAHLPRIESRSEIEPPAAIGRNTEAAINSGLYWGQVGAVLKIMERMMHCCNHDQPLLLLTGGAAKLLHPHLPETVRLQPHLVLQGLALTALTPNDADSGS